jgi:hypothetical protein
MVERVIARFFFEYCLFSRLATPCTARQMRKGFLTINTIVWILIILAFKFVV